MASDRRRILSANPMTPDSRFTVYFDGNCPICSREIATYRRSRGGETIDWIDASHSEAAALD
jgi:predicted DCC family thiol-disulfide oxidoreductase YuxK